MKPLVSVFFLALLVFPASGFAQLPPLKPLKGTPAPSAPKDPDKFTFILAGDNRPEKSADPPTDVTQQIFNEIKKQSPAFVLWTGDVIYGKDPSSPDAIGAQYEAFLKVAATGNAAVYNAPGNHEMNDKSNCPNSQMLTYYLDDTDQKQPYGAFDYGDSHFIALDSDEDTPAGDPCNCSSQPGGSKPPGYISDTQMAMLAKDLEANKTKAHIFIFLHRPLVGYKGADQLCPANVSAMQNLFKQYRTISYVVAGHQHMYYNPQGPDIFKDPPVRKDPAKKPYYLVSGGGGAPLKGKGFYHYLVFTVDKAKVSVQVVPVDATEDTN